MGKKIGIWGWWQGNNLGDNWIKSTLMKFFPYAECIPTSVQEFIDYDFVICGGGGLFIYDVINPFKNVDIGIPYGIFGMGAEFEHSSGIAQELEKRAKFFYVRDDYSIDCMHLSRKCKSFDVTFLNPLPLAVENDKNTVFFVWRDGRELIRNDKFAEYIRFDDVKELWIECIERKFDSIIYDDFQTNEDNIYERIKDCDFVISGRYHGIVAAIQRGIPFIAIDICPKIRAIAQECGLEEYCIKISEIGLIENLINQAKENKGEIRAKEIAYRNIANSCLVGQIDCIYQEIIKALFPYKLLHYGSYWMGENDVVNVMSDDLKMVSNSKKIDLKAYSGKIDGRIKAVEKTPNGTVCTLDTDKIIEDINDFEPDAIVLNSGGLCMNEDLIQELKSRKIVSVGISLSDPDVYPYNGKKYSEDFDMFYTNSRYSLENQYNNNSNIYLMPFAASLRHHYYMPTVERKYDLVVVGHARPDRNYVISQLESICKIGLYGNGWENGLGSVNGIEHVKAINSGRMYLSFSHTNAGFDNVKVGLFEAMACKQFVITSYMDELKDYFKIGEEIVCYKDVEELKKIITYYMLHVDEREQIREKGYLRFVSEHTYKHRWMNVLREIEIRKG